MSEWVGVEKEVADKVQVKTKQHKATDEGNRRRAERQKLKRRRGGGGDKGGKFIKETVKRWARRKISV